MPMEGVVDSSSVGEDGTFSTGDVCRGCEDRGGGGVRVVASGGGEGVGRRGGGGGGGGGGGVEGGTSGGGHGGGGVSGGGGGGCDGDEGSGGGGGEIGKRLGIMLRRVQIAVSSALKTSELLSTVITTSSDCHTHIAWPPCPIPQLG